MKIEKGVPIPASMRGRPVKYVFDGMAIDDSLFFKSKNKKFSGVRNAAREFGKLNGWEFVTRKMNGGLRVWRIK